MEKGELLVSGPQCGGPELGGPESQLPILNLGNKVLASDLNAGAHSAVSYTHLTLPTI